MNELPPMDEGLPVSEGSPSTAAPEDPARRVLFSDFPLAQDVLDCLDGMGITEPTPIQEKVTQPILNGRDVIGKAETGTGKTIGFGAPLIGKIDTSRVAIQGLILTPTRELALQVSQVIEQLGARRGLKVALVVGGVHASEQIKQIRRGCQVVVGTPGRILDFLKDRIMSLVWTETLVIDEADRMFDMGFIDDIHRIIGHLPETRQTLLFSATIPPGIQGLMKKYMKDPETYSTSSGLSTVSEIQQSYREVEFRAKFDELRRIIDNHPDETIIIFTNTRRQAIDLDRMLWGHNYPARALHGNHDQETRFKVLESFRQNETRILVATDVASRGLDVEDVNLVVNFEVPIDVESYVHRIGRTGRASKTGEAITLVAGKEMTTWRRILKSPNFEIQKGRRASPGTPRDVTESTSSKSSSSASSGPSSSSSSRSSRRSSSSSSSPSSPSPRPGAPARSGGGERSSEGGDDDKRRRRRRRRRGGERSVEQSGGPRSQEPEAPKDSAGGEQSGGPSGQEREAPKDSAGGERSSTGRSDSRSDDRQSGRDRAQRDRGRRKKTSADSSSDRSSDRTPDRTPSRSRSSQSGGSSHPGRPKTEASSGVDLFDVSMKDFLDVSRPIEEFKTQPENESTSGTGFQSSFADDDETKRRAAARSDGGGQSGSGRSDSGRAGSSRSDSARSGSDRGSAEASGTTDSAGGADSGKGGSGASKKRRRRRRKPDGGSGPRGGEGATASTSSPASGEKSDTDSDGRPRRRRRRRRRGGGTGESKSGGGGESGGGAGSSGT
jgi:ATP-dependent RNA helicase DeaD